MPKIEHFFVIFATYNCYMNKPKISYKYYSQEQGGIKKGKYKIIRETLIDSEHHCFNTLVKNLGKGEMEDLLFRYENNLIILKK